MILSRKFAGAGRPDLALGALAEDGTVYLDPRVRDWPEGVRGYLEVEKRFQAAEIARRKKLFLRRAPAAPIAGRSVIVTDDGIATGGTIMAVLDVLRGQRPRELIVATAVCSPERDGVVRRCCDDLVYLVRSENFPPIGQLYADFREIGDEEVRELLHRFAPGNRAETVATG